MTTSRFIIISSLFVGKCFFFEEKEGEMFGGSEIMCNFGATMTQLAMKRLYLIGIFLSLTMALPAQLSKNVYITLDVSGSMSGDKYVLANYTTQMIVTLCDYDDDVHMIVYGQEKILSKERNPLLPIQRPMNSLSFGRPMSTMSQFDDIIGLDKIKVFHINDSKNERESHKDRHENIGFGKIGYDALMKFINDERFTDIPKILETPYVKNGDDSFPPYKYEIEMIRRGLFNHNLIEDVINQK